MALQVPAQPGVVLLAYDLAALSNQPVLSDQELHDELRTHAQSCALGQCSGRSSLNLHGALKVQLQGLSQPVSLCAEPNAEALDVTPCVNPSLLRSGSPVASLDSKGDLHFTRQANLQQVLALVHNQPSLSIPVMLGDQTLITLDFPIHFVRLEGLHFIGPRGGAGLNLRVWVDARDTQRLVFTVQTGSHKYIAAVDRRGANHFSIVSSGGVGFGGEAGRDGGPGVNGEDGGRGTHGSPGGDISVQVACGPADCSEVIELLRRMISSEGGPGGNGGEGGTGTPYTAGAGRGGVVVILATPGRAGQDGQNGRPGHVRFTSGPDWVSPPPAIELPSIASTAVSSETLTRIKTQLEQAIASQQGLLTACRRTYGKEEISATARITMDSAGSVTGTQIEGVGSNLAICVERVLKMLTVAPIRERMATVEVQVSFSH
jgi:hypothetical protein